ncbi:MAG: hypothetical protein DWQ19_11480 [Crenarchaeota archaeon]|mgnify:CR=1 FL=1|nr:MAG: hypothetical protein DWQ19_11480 [Thermoproteota archaeon]
MNCPKCISQNIETHSPGDNLKLDVDMINSTTQKLEKFPCYDEDVIHHGCKDCGCMFYLSQQQTIKTHYE